MAAPSTVRVLLRVLGCVASCFPTASFGPGGFELTHPVLLFSADSGGNIQGGSKVDTALLGKRVVIVPNYEQGTWSDKVVVPVRNTVPVADKADPLQLAMIGINPATAYLLLHRYVSLMPGDWIGQTAANSAMGQYIIALARLAGVKPSTWSAAPKPRNRSVSLVVTAWCSKAITCAKT